MLISEFSRVSGLTPDTIRFYVRKGLLAPRITDKGGRNPYMIFNAQHVIDSKLIRLGQLLGLPLKEIGNLISQARADDLNEALARERHVKMIDEQIGRIEQKSAELALMADYLRRKRTWVECGRDGTEPELFSGESMGCAGLAK